MMNKQITKIILVVAIALVLGVLWSKWDAKYEQTNISTTQNNTQSGHVDTNKPTQVPDLSLNSSNSHAVAKSKSSAPISLNQAGDSSGKTVSVNNGLMLLKINLDGGNVVSAKLLKYSKSLQDSAPVHLMSTKKNDFYVAQSGLVGKGFNNQKIKYTAKQSSYTLGDKNKLTINLYAKTSNGLIVEKQYTVHKGRYLVDVNYKVTNNSSKTWHGRFYGQLLRVPPTKHRHGILSSYTSFTGAVVSTPSEHFSKLTFSDIANSNYQQTADPGGWAAMVEHYFTSAWVPTHKQKTEVYSRVFGSNTYGVGIANPTISIAPGKTNTTGAQLYIGPGVSSRLEAVAPYLNLTIDYGWLYFISEFLFFLMTHIYQLVGNWGVSIILVTILIKAVFYPLSAKSYRSMAKMRMLQPKMKALKEQFGSDKQAMGKATMELYRKEKVNPLSGCLPILIQIPVFIALYWMLMASVELRQAPFIFWIKDLSVHDPYYVLPILMGLSMFVQQRLNPPPPDPTQAKVMMMLPVVFTVLFLGFPSGLVLYWLCNNCISILQQWYVLRKVERESATQKKIASAKR